MGIKKEKRLQQNRVIELDSISDLYDFAHMEAAPAYPDFDILFFSDFRRDVKKMLPPHRRDFFTVIFFEDQKDGLVNINSEAHRALTNAVLFQGKEHIFSFVRDEEVKGAILLFKPSFLLPYVKDSEFKYPFFSLFNQNLFHLSASEHQAFGRFLALMQTELKQKETLKHLLLALLEKCLSLQESYAREEQYISKKYLLARRFKQLVNNYFHSEKQVEFYAGKMNLTANYLNEVVKSQTNKTAKRHILDRILLEAQNLLSYTDLDIAEIAYALNFSETSHFNRFFKKETQVTPRNFRQRDR